MIVKLVGTLVGRVRTFNIVDNGRYAVQGHSRSLILAPIESPYAASLVNDTNVHSISHCFPVIAQ